MTYSEGLAAAAAPDPDTPPIGSPSAWAGPPSRAGRGFWARLLGWRGAQPDERQRAAVARDRRPPGLELLLVLAVFPGVATLSAVASLVTDALGDGGSHGGYVAVELPGHAVVSALLDVPFVVLDVVGAVLVAYLLMVSGGGLAALGLDRRRVRRDLAVAGKLWFLAYLVPFLVGGAVLSALDIGGGGGVTTPPEAVYLLPLLVSAVVAGVVEEVVVLGFLVHRLEQRGWTPGGVLLLAASVRVSYHLYYGLEVLPLVGWAVVSVLLYRRRRRLLPFIAVHALWDLSSFGAQYLSDGASVLPYLLMGSVLTVLWATRPRAVEQDRPLYRLRSTPSPAPPAPRARLRLDAAPAPARRAGHCPDSSTEP